MKIAQNDSIQKEIQTCQTYKKKLLPTCFNIIFIYKIFTVDSEWFIAIWKN